MLLKFWVSKSPLNRQYVVWRKVVEIDKKKPELRCVSIQCIPTPPHNRHDMHKNKGDSELVKRTTTNINLISLIVS